MLIRFGEAIVPFSLLPLVAVLAGGLLGPRLGFTSMLIYAFLGVLGMPVFARPPFGGPAYVLQPTFGFIPGFAVAAYITGRLLGGKENASIWWYIVSMAVGVAATYVVGLPYLYGILVLVLGNRVSVGKLMTIGFVPFIIPDLIKAAIAAVVARAIHQRLARGRRSRGAA